MKSSHTHTIIPIGWGGSIDLSVTLLNCLGKGDGTQEHLAVSILRFIEVDMYTIKLNCFYHI